jgi:NADP-dependent 3-hydroxy acid dehydrogenase YdfG
MDALRGRVVIVTGASSGIGTAIARTLAAAGAKVVLAARREAALQQAVATIADSGDEAHYVVADLCNEAAIDHLIDSTVERFGQLDALVNNAARGALRLIAEGHSDEWRAVIETNLIGTLTACRAALRHMLPRAKGDIINITSASAHEAWPYLAVYAASKAALHTASQALRAEVAPHGIRVMTLEVHNVGGTEFAAGFEPLVLAEAVQRWQQLGLLRRDSGMLRPEDVGQAVLYQLAQTDPACVHHLSLRTRGN